MSQYSSSDEFTTVHERSECDDALASTSDVNLLHETIMKLKEKCKDLEFKL